MTKYDDYMIMIRDTCDSPLRAGEKAVDLFQGFMYRKVFLTTTIAITIIIIITVTIII